MNSIRPAVCVAKGCAPGLAWGVVADGRLVHAAGLGELHVGTGDLPTADSSFRIASMSKSFVAAMILLLRDEGRVRLDDRVDQHVPELQGLPLPTADSPAPTLRDLMSMRSGYPEDDPWADRLDDAFQGLRVVGRAVQVDTGDDHTARWLLDRQLADEAQIAYRLPGQERHVLVRLTRRLAAYAVWSGHSRAHAQLMVSTMLSRNCSVVCPSVGVSTS